MMPKIIRIMVVLLVVVILIPPNLYSGVDARSIDDIQDDIDQKNGELDQVEANLASAQSKLNQLVASLQSAEGEIPKLKAEIEQIDANIEWNSLQMEFLNESKNLKDLEREEREVRQGDAMHNAYKSWRVNNRISAHLSGSSANPVKLRKYQSQVLAKEQEGIWDLEDQILGLLAEISDFEQETEDLKEKNKGLKTQKEQLEAQLAMLQNSYSSTSGVVAGLRNEAGILQASLEQLSEEQRVVAEYEAWLLGQAGNGGTQEVNAGEFYLTGRGRDVAQGHGVGMSQYGAKGAADQGWTAEQILQFYYTGATVGTYAVSDQISVKYCANNPALDAYQNGCDGGAAPVTERVSFDTYLSGLGEMPESWPIEARRAQMIAARTYAVRYTANGNASYPICLTTYCQVSYFKDGDTREMDIVQSTDNIVITYGGQMIEALYSADNNQGLGSADHDTRFQNIYGQATGSRPYLVAKNDNQFADSSRMYWEYYCPGAPCGLWGWRTNGYSMADFDQMLDHVNHNSYYSHVAPAINQIRAEIGNIQAITFVRDGTEHVKKVRLTGTTGATREIGGWWFKSIWNSWVYHNQPTGQYDYIYSLTFFLLQK